jgi:hypothetical protein
MREKGGRNASEKRRQGHGALDNGRHAERRWMRLERHEATLTMEKGVECCGLHRALSLADLHISADVELSV